MEADTSEATPVSFGALGLIPELCQACEKLKYTHPTPIQAAAIPEALAGRDIIGLAETGSGKTAAFALPILQALMATPTPLFACVLSPTRELAFQIAEQFQALGAGIGVRVATITGGMDHMAQAIALSKKPHIVVASPGRLLDHLESTKGFTLRTIKYLVLDEADRLLDVDFGAILDKLLSIFPKQRQTYLFSATMTSKIAKLQRASLTNPVRVAINAKYQTVSTLLQYYLFFPFRYKDTYLVFLLNEMPGQSCIVFARTCNDVQRLAFMLRALGFKAVPIHGQLGQSSRLGALNKFRSGERNVLIATDVAARGLDIPQVDCVINYSIPTDSKSYIHRVGRTARAGRAGKSLSLVAQYDLEVFVRIEKALGRKLPEYKVESEQVLLLQERVSEAQREAVQRMREVHEREGGGKKGKHKPGKNVWGVKGGKIEKNRDDMDKEEV